MARTDRQNMPERVLRACRLGITTEECGQRFGRPGQLAKSTLTVQGYVTRSADGTWRLTERGREALARRG